MLGMRGAVGAPALFGCSKQGTAAGEGCCGHAQADSCKKSRSESTWPQLRAERGRKALRPGRGRAGVVAGVAQGVGNILAMKRSSKNPL